MKEEFTAQRMKDGNLALVREETRQRRDIKGLEEMANKTLGHPGLIHRLHREKQFISFT